MIKVKELVGFVEVHSYQIDTLDICVKKPDECYASPNDCVYLPFDKHTRKYYEDFYVAEYHLINSELRITYVETLPEDEEDESDDDYCILWESLYKHRGSLCIKKLSGETLYKGEKTDESFPIDLWTNKVIDADYSFIESNDDDCEGLLTIYVRERTYRPRPKKEEL